MENNNKLAIVEKDISDTVLNRVKELEGTKQLVLPSKYNVGNALKSAYLTLYDNNLLNCDKNSIAQSLLDMVIQGLTPAKNQCHFINYGGKLKMSRSYFGDVAVCKHTGMIENEPFAVVVYKGDEIEVGFDELGRKVVKKHETKFENLDNEIIGAYAKLQYANGKEVYEIMTINEIKKSWKMSNTVKAGKKSQLQEDFAQEACKRTVIRRLVKMIFNTSLDDNAVVESYTRTTKEEAEREEVINAEFEVKSVEEKEAKVKAEAGQKVIPKKEDKTQEEVIAKNVEEELDNQQEAEFNIFGN